mmetsp:Transcript_68226/g.171946  ORF Transcript_68226/g.171946 Transcript_68226/m.171946 type:complete len:223 (-) Transcript_68226:354-1022(-)
MRTNKRKRKSSRSSASALAAEPAVVTAARRAGKQTRVLPLGSIMRSRTSSLVVFAGKAMSSGVTASRRATSRAAAEEISLGAGAAGTPLGEGMEPKYVSSMGSKTSLFGSRPTRTNVHSLGLLTRSLKMALAFLKSRRKMFQRLGSRLYGWSCVMQRWTRFRKRACGSRFSPNRQAKKLNLTSESRPRDFSPGSTGERKRRWRRVRRASRSAGDAEASRAVL